jgi:hypothetical protein
MENQTFENEFWESAWCPQWTLKILLLSDGQRFKAVSQHLSLKTLGFIESAKVRVFIFLSAKDIPSDRIIPGSVASVQNAYSFDAFNTASAFTQLLR